MGISRYKLVAPDTVGMVQHPTGNHLVGLQQTGEEQMTPHFTEPDQHGRIHLMLGDIVIGTVSPVETFIRAAAGECYKWLWYIRLPYGITGANRESKLVRTKDEAIAGALSVFRLSLDRAGLQIKKGVDE